jgi:hypothetical protein
MPGIYPVIVITFTHALPDEQRLYESIRAATIHSDLWLFESECRRIAKLLAHRKLTPRIFEIAIDMALYKTLEESQCSEVAIKAYYAEHFDNLKTAIWNVAKPLN